MNKISASVSQLHQYAWQPARYAHPLWLHHLGINSLHYQYGKYPTFDSALNSELIRQRGFPTSVLPAILSPAAEQRLSLAPRMRAVCMLLGVIMLNCMEYLRVRVYRQTLVPFVEEQMVHQLFGLGFAGPLSAQLLPAQLPTVAFSLGHGFLAAISPTCEVWQALLIMLPPYPRAIWSSAALRWLKLLEKLL